MNSLRVREWSHSSLSMMAVGNNFTSAKAENQVERAFWGRILSFPLKSQSVSLVAQRVKNLSAMWEIWVRSLGKIPWRMERLPTPVFWPGKFHGLYSPRGHKESDSIK